MNGGHRKVLSVLRTCAKHADSRASPLSHIFCAIVLSFLLSSSFSLLSPSSSFSPFLLSSCLVWSTSFMLASDNSFLALPCTTNSHQKKKRKRGWELTFRAAELRWRPTHSASCRLRLRAKGPLFGYCLTMARDIEEQDVVWHCDIGGESCSGRES
jgi:hypothetical protein